MLHRFNMQYLNSWCSMGNLYHLLNACCYRGVDRPLISIPVSRRPSILSLVRLASFSGKRNATVWRPSVRPSVCRVIFLNLTECAAHTKRDSPGGSTRLGLRTFSSEYYEDGHTCYSYMTKIRCCEINKCIRSLWCKRRSSTNLTVLRDLRKLTSSF